MQAPLYPGLCGCGGQTVQVSIIRTYLAELFISRLFAFLPNLLTTINSLLNYSFPSYSSIFRALLYISSVAKTCQTKRSFLIFNIQRGVGSEYKSC